MIALFFLIREQGVSGYQKYLFQILSTCILVTNILVFVHV